jgi:hypothetical protein
MNTTQILEEVLRTGRVSGVAQSIVMLVTENGLTAEQIAETLALDTAGVEAILASAPVQKAVVRVASRMPEEQRTDLLASLTGRELCEEAIQKIRSLMHDAESEKVQLDAAIFVAEAAAGLKAPKKTEAAVTTQDQIKLAFEQAFAVYQQNQMKAANVVERTMKNGKVIELEAIPA